MKQKLPELIMLFSLLLCIFDGAALAARMDDACSLAQAKATSAQLKVQRDEDAIRSLGFAQRSEDMDAWVKLSEDARTKFMSDAFDMLLASTNSAVSAGGSLNPPSANTAISRLRAAGINSAPLNDAIRRLASTPGKAARAKDIRHFLDEIGSFKAGFEMTGTNWSDRQSVLEAVSSVLGLFETNPQLALLAADLKFTSSSIYNNATRMVSEAQIDRLNGLTEKDLLSLKHLSDQLMTDVRDQNTFRAQLNSSCDRNKEITALGAKTLSRRDGLRACTDRMMAQHHACGDHPPLAGPEWKAWNTCMDAANSAYDSCVASLPK